MQSANWVSAENGLCVVQTTEINEFGTGSKIASSCSAHDITWAEKWDALLFMVNLLLHWFDNLMVSTSVFYKMNFRPLSNPLQSGNL